MAQKGVQLDREAFSCSICLDLLKDPVTIPCGHSYCMNCIKRHWDEEDQRHVHSCPQCRKTFRPRPELVKSTMLAALVEELKKTGLQAAAADHCYAGAEDVACDVCTGRKLKALKSYGKILQLEVEAISRSADKAVEHSEKIFTELIRLLEKRRSDVKQQIRSQQETEVSRVKELQQKLEQEITELKRKDAGLEQLSHTEDPTQFLLNYPSVSALSQSTHSSSIDIRPLTYFEDVTAAVSEVRDKLQDILRETWTNISLTLTKPKPRDGFLRYSCEITLDPNTANTWLLLSEGNRKVTSKKQLHYFIFSQQQSYSSHPDRFNGWFQVLSRESLTGRCYWEVEWRARGVGVAVTYKDIRRTGESNESRFGYNDKSWALHCDQNSYNFCYNNIQTPVSRPRSSRLGVYLDHTAGILSFYSVSKTMTLLHRVQTTFTQPLYAGLGLYCDGNSAEFIKLK
uniref:tripartite motif-containing protein 16-like protein n=1 Tax=Monopterus albus TaxID=43700 RepID=UPI0009B4C940|nr:tripartite motif-containing protein 16-like protein [Monopterus albus]